MAYGACPQCGCSHGECECLGRGVRPKKIPSKPKTRRSGMQIGDWVRVRRGRLQGAEGRVVESRQGLPEISIAQLNGCVIRLPRAHLEFAAFKTDETDTLL